MNIPITLIVFLCLSVSSCTNKVDVTNVQVLKSSLPKLEQNKTLLLDEWVKNSVPKCGFLFKESNEVTSKSILKCMDGFHFPENSDYLQTKFFLDRYLGEKLQIYLLKLSSQDLTSILKHVIYSDYFDNPKFLKTLIDMGAQTEDILLQEIGVQSNNSCEVSMLILKKNISLYKNKKTLNESVIYEVSKYPEHSKHSGYRRYRKNVLFYFTYNHADSTPCSDVVEFLLKENPELRDSNSEYYYHSTPLHSYMSGFGSGRDIKVATRIGKKLISPENINLQDKRGKTPLHILLGNIRLSSAPTDLKYIKMSQILLKSGADVDIKDKKGITARDLFKEAKELIYRKDVMFSAINEGLYLHCKDQVLAEALIRVNPDLRDTIRDLKG